MAAEGEVASAKAKRGRKAKMSRKRPSLGVVLGSGLLLALALLAAWGLVATWDFAGEVKISVHGYIAMAIGCVGTIALTAGLIWLAYYSARKGFDQPPDAP